MDRDPLANTLDYNNCIKEPIHKKAYAELTIAPNWGGGDVMCGDTLLSKMAGQEVTLLIKDVLLRAVTVEFEGVDHDYGKQYPWKNIDLNVYLKTEIGTITKSLRELMRDELAGAKVLMRLPND